MFFSDVQEINYHKRLDIALIVETLSICRQTTRVGVRRQIAELFLQFEECLSENKVFIHLFTV